MPIPLIMSFCINTWVYDGIFFMGFLEENKKHEYQELKHVQKCVYVYMYISSVCVYTHIYQRVMFLTINTINQLKDNGSIQRQLQAQDMIAKACLIKYWQVVHAQFLPQRGDFKQSIAFGVWRVFWGFLGILKTHFCLLIVYCNHLERCNASTGISNTAFLHFIQLPLNCQGWQYMLLRFDYYSSLFVCLLQMPVAFQRHKSWHSVKVQPPLFLNSTRSKKW